MDNAELQSRCDNAMARVQRHIDHAVDQHSRIVHFHARMVEDRIARYHTRAVVAWIDASTRARVELNHYEWIESLYDWRP